MMQVHSRAPRHILMFPKGDVSQYAMKPGDYYIPTTGGPAVQVPGKGDFGLGMEVGAAHPYENLMRLSDTIATGIRNLGGPSANPHTGMLEEYLKNNGFGNIPVIGGLAYTPQEDIQAFQNHVQNVENSKGITPGKVGQVVGEIAGSAPLLALGRRCSGRGSRGGCTFSRTLDRG